ncbi:hypothetical protein B0T26DRAFT_803816 [Lasiosphaeria miniovina]|uniref:Uncharacterized protein n=1 Tax=Lasiosphaeria miniovina TaxID=1954250 RepID=A0AA40ABQ9_9PEZI|nr:uncharacterized protein B0T26DRAFT_803816 [Lasiosphaeria miniovina]KAK0712854.1 hypothetical protein B0T26DRAFT_803816 [Lasiosphaeria miniovina]
MPMWARPPLPTKATKVKTKESPSHKTMCRTREIHFSVHDVCGRMATELFSADGVGDFTDPTRPLSCRCDIFAVFLIWQTRRSLAEITGCDDGISWCARHTCCVRFLCVTHCFDVLAQITSSGLEMWEQAAEELVWDCPIGLTTHAYQPLSMVTDTIDLDLPGSKLEYTIELADDTISRLESDVSEVECERVILRRLGRLPVAGRPTTASEDTDGSFYSISKERLDLADLDSNDIIAKCEGPLKQSDNLRQRIDRLREFMKGAEPVPRVSLKRPLNSTEDGDSRKKRAKLET